MAAVPRNKPEQKRTWTPWASPSVGLRGFMLSTVCGVALILSITMTASRSNATQTSSAQKTKQKASAAGTAKVAGKWERVLLDLERDYVAPLEGPDAKLTAGKPVDLLLDTGKRFDNLEVTELQLGKGIVRAIAVKHTDKNTTQKFQIGAVSQIHSGDTTFDVVFSPDKKGYVLIDGAKRDQVVGDRLRPRGHRLWGEFPVSEQAQFVEEHKAFLKNVGDAFAPTPMQLSETDYFLFYTDMPLNQVGGYIAYLDAMYLELCNAFGVPRGKNIWRGKCVIVAFATKESFVKFENQFMQAPVTDSTQGRYHGSATGTSITSCWRGNEPAFFAHVLVHETSHGFMHRYRSTVHIPPWINEGVADWVAAAVVRNCPETERRQNSALTEMKRTGSMGANFFAEQTRLERWQYGTASQLTGFMLAAGPDRYRTLLTAIKEGYSWEKSLNLAYGWTPEELVQRYGTSIGMPSLQPSR